MFSFGPVRQGRYCPTALCGRRPAIRPVAEEEKPRLGGRSAQFEPAACRETIKPLHGAETAHDRTESARCDRFLQRPEQVLLLCGGDHQHPLRQDAERGEPMPVKVSALLRLAARAAEAEVFRCARRKRQGKGKRYSLIAWTPPDAAPSSTLGCRGSRSMSQRHYAPGDMGFKIEILFELGKCSVAAGQPSNITLGTWPLMMPNHASGRRRIC